MNNSLKARQVGRGLFGTHLINGKGVRCRRFEAAARREEGKYPSVIFDRRATPQPPQRSATLRAEFWRAAGCVAPQSSRRAGTAMLLRRALPAARQNLAHHLPIYKMGSKSLCIALLLLTCCTLSAQNEGHRVRNIVLVHGAWADGSGWKGVYDILVKDGYNVSIVQEPETSFKEDVAATKRVLAQQDGPCILVAHSYGGAVITEAGTDPSVVGLVYVAAHMPDAGENEADDGKRFPSDLSKSGAIKKTADGFTYLDPAQFHEYFAADLSAEQAAFMARSQVLNAADNFKAVITTAAWRSKPSWMLVAAKDRTINPDLERWYAERANSHKVEVSGASHSVYVSRPKEVAALIEEAATHAR
jgi:pimeloyl-ACP methyl ester carboxylesterase